MLWNVKYELNFKSFSQYQSNMCQTMRFKIGFINAKTSISSQ